MYMYTPLPVQNSNSSINNISTTSFLVPRSSFLIPRSHFTSFNLSRGYFSTERDYADDYLASKSGYRSILFPIVGSESSGFTFILGSLASSTVGRNGLPPLPALVLPSVGLPSGSSNPLELSDNNLAFFKPSMESGPARRFISREW